MKPVCVWNLKDDCVRWSKRPPQGAAIWRVRLWVTRAGESAEREVIPKEPVTLRDLINSVLPVQVDELLAELPGPSNMGFEVFKWR